jgi:hypothetical protein
MPDLELSLHASTRADEHDVARLLRAWFDAIIDGLSADVLAVVREQCVRAERSCANVEIVATIDRRLQLLRESPPRGS